MKEIGHSILHRDSGDPETFRTIEIAVLLVIAIVAIVAIDLLFYSSTLEDAFITFRYSEHLAEGHGFGAWNTQGERVEGYTTFLWMLLMSAAHASGIDVRSAAKILGILMHLILCSTLIAFPLLRRESVGRRDDLFASPNEVVLAGLFLALYLPLAWYATSGMETVFFTALTGLAFLAVFLRRGAVLLPILSALLVLTRPEGIVVAAAAVLLDAIVRKREGRPLGGAYLAAALAALALGLLVVHRLILFGEFVPNTYWAKAGGASMKHILWGLKYVTEWTSDHGIVVFLWGVGALGLAFSLTRARRRDLPAGFSVVLVLALAFVAYIVKIGGDNLSAFPHYRHFVHLAAPMAFLSCYALVRLLPRSRYFQLLVLLGIVLVTNMSALRSLNYTMLKSLPSPLTTYPVLTHAEHSEYLTRLRQISRPGTTIASSLGGELPYVVDAVHIDILGLNTRHVAKHGSFDPGGPQDSKTNMPWVLEQRPDIIEGYFPGTLVIESTPQSIREYLGSHWRSRMNLALVASPVFQTEYLFVRNWPYHSLDRALFIRDSYLADHPDRDELDCVAVADTPLGESPAGDPLYPLKEN